MAACTGSNWSALQPMMLLPATVSYSLHCVTTSSAVQHAHSTLMLLPYLSCSCMQSCWFFSCPMSTRSQQPTSPYKPSVSSAICKENFVLFFFLWQCRQGSPTLDGINCTHSWCNHAESEEDVQLELQVPFWIDANEVHIDIGEHQLKVSVRNTFCFSRSYWISRYSINSTLCLSCIQQA